MDMFMRNKIYCILLIFLIFSCNRHSELNNCSNLKDVKLLHYIEFIEFEKMKSIKIMTLSGNVIKEFNKKDILLSKQNSFLIQLDENVKGKMHNGCIILVDNKFNFKLKDLNIKNIEHYGMFGFYRL